MKQALVGTCIRLLLCLLLNVNVWAEKQNNLSVSISYGEKYVLPSLIANSEIEFNRKMSYSDFWFEGGFQISDKLRFEGALELTDQPHELIGTKFSRPDYPLSTGRFQQSVVSYTSEKLTIKLGRDDMLSSDLRPYIFDYPIYADGIGWSYTWRDWNFEHVYQTLPAERESDQIFRRSVSYHHLSKTFNYLTFGAGEYFILTGESMQLDLKRLNPFLPYSLNSHDSEADDYPDFTGDTDNSLIKLFLNWGRNSNKVSINLYIDEFHIDAVDREVYSDAILLSLSAENEFTVFGQRSKLNWGFSAANPNFGQHPGPFTTTTFASFPLFEYTPGMKNLVYFDSRILKGKEWEILFAGHSEQWVNISQLTPALMNNRAELNTLKVNSESRLILGLRYKLNKYPINVGIEGWSGSDSGMRLKIQFQPNRGIKQ
jgi:hypothetical protein